MGGQGGGALRLSVGGILTVDGQLSADGKAALQDNGGGGSGGSIWATAGAVTGNGFISAIGGMGDLYYGGGGGGGRDRTLYPSQFLFPGQSPRPAQTVTARGGDGTIFVSNSVARLQILSHSPVGVVSNGVSSVDLFFNAPPAAGAVSPTVFSLNTRNGPLSAGVVAVSYVSPEHYQLTFPLQTAVGIIRFW